MPSLADLALGPASPVTMRGLATTGALGPMGPVGPSPASPNVAGLGSLSRNAILDPSTGQPSPLLVPSLYGQAAAPAGVAAPAGAPNYADEYARAMAASQAGIANQFHMALSDIAQREGLAGQAVGQLPGQLNEVYGASDKNMMTGAASMDAAQKASGLNSFMSAGAQMAPLGAAIGENKATALSGVPLLALAVKTQMSNERAALEQSHQSALAQLAAQNLGNISDQAKTANAQQFAQQQAQQANTWDTQRQATSLQQQMTLAQMANDSRVEPKTNMTIGEINAVKQTPQYHNAMSLLTQGMPTGNGMSGTRATTLKDIESRYAGFPNMMKVIALEFPGLK